MKKILTGSLICALLTGCSLIPDFKKPDVETPPAWKAADATAPADQKVAPDWWTAFGSTELNGFMTQALDQNNDLRAALARIEQARANARIAGATLMPSVSGNAGLDLTRSKGGRRGSSSFVTGGSSIVSGGGTGDKATYNRSADAGVVVSYEVDLFGGNRASVAAAEAGVEGSIYDQQALALTTMGDVAGTYFLTLNLRERVKIAEQNLKNAQEVLRIVDARFNAGASSALEVAQQKTVLASNQAALSTLKAQETNAENALAVLVGKPPQTIEIKSDSLKDLTVPGLAPTQPSTLLERRPDIRSAEASLVAANANIGVARAAFMPKLDLGAGLSFAFNPLTAPLTTVVSGSSSLLAPIFTGGSLEGQLDLAKARQAELVENYRKTVLVSFQETEDALTATRAGRERETALKESVTQAQRSYDLSRQLYNSGAVDFQTLLNAQASLLSAEDNYAAVRLEMLQASINLYKALGGGWQTKTAITAANAANTGPAVPALPAAPVKAEPIATTPSGPAPLTITTEPVAPKAPVAAPTAQPAKSAPGWPRPFSR